VPQQFISQHALTAIWDTSSHSQSTQSLASSHCPLLSPLLLPLLLLLLLFSLLNCAAAAAVDSFAKMMGNAYNMNGLFGVDAGQLKQMNLPEQHLQAANRMRSNFRCAVL
jgi:hypothetical protein